MLNILIIIIDTLFAVFLLKYLSHPYIGISIFCLLSFIILTLKSKITLKKAVWFNLAFVVFLFGVLEIYSYSSFNNENNFRQEGGCMQEYSTSDDVLGYAPLPNKTVTSQRYFQRYFKDLLLYDVTYTIDDNGHRITPGATAQNDSQSIIFFGCSFTFGEGVNDSESMPYIVGELQKDKVYNYGFHGYGPHQMLSAIENNLISCNPKYVIYQAHHVHAARSAGYSSWDYHGPKYIIEGGELVFCGNFDDSEYPTYTKIKRKIYNQLNKSNFFIKYFSKKDRYTITDNDISLFLNIVSTAQEKLIKKFPNVKFHVILWDKTPSDKTYLKIRKGLNLMTNNIHYVSDILPNLCDDTKKYEISKYDTHPNPLAHKLIAEYVVNNILSKNSTHEPN